MRSALRASLAALATVCLLVVSTPAAATVPGPAQAPEWWFDTWRLPALWSSGADGRGVTVAVLDTGVQADLPELAGRVLAGANFAGTPAAGTPSAGTPSAGTTSAGTTSAGTTSGGRQSSQPPASADPAALGQVDLDDQPFSHGTAMASLIVGRPGPYGIEGSAPAARVLPVVVPLTEETGGAATPVGATADAIRYAADRGATVISMSFGALRDPSTDPDPCPQDVQDAVDYALRKGALLVAAAGNQGATGSPVAEPGVCLGVISVGSVDDRLRVSSFSSRQPYLTLTAPGEQIATLSKAGTGFVGFGTSQATALAAAAIALVWSKYPSESNAEILSRVLSTATDLGPSGHDSSYGYGFLSPAAAIASTAPVTSNNPVFAAVRPLLAPAAALPAPVAPAGRSDAPLGESVPEPVRTPKPPLFWLLSVGALIAFAAALGLASAARSARRLPR